MARSPINNPLAFPAEVARFLCVEPSDVKRMIKLDQMPSTLIPKKTRTVTRIPLRDFHAWLKNRSQNSVANVPYETFLADFNETARAATA
jgi:hypothetical protein